MTRDRKPAGIGSLAPNQLLILNGVNTNLISRSLQNVLTNFLILRCVMMEKGPMYGYLKYNNYCYYMSLLSTIIIIKLAMCKLPQKLAKSSCRIIAKTLWSVAFHWSSVLAPSIVKCRSIPLTQISINTSIDTQSRLDLCLTDISMDTQSTVYH